MKRFLFLFTIIALYSSMAFAQNEVATDTLRQETGNIPPAEEQLLPDGTRNYGGFLIDMNSLIKMPTPDLSKSFKIVIPNASKDYSQLFRLNPDVTYSSGLSNMFSSGSSFYLNPFGLNSVGSLMENLQMGSFKLKNGMRINTYGEYNKEGRKVFNPSALPWERNNFKGAFELKSQDGSFGFRIEVQQGRNSPY